MKKYIHSITLIFFVLISFSCKDDKDEGATLSFSRSIYILDPMGALDVELRASEAPTERMVVPVTVTGSAVIDEDYTMSAQEFVFEAGETTAKITIEPKDNLNPNRDIKLDIQEVGEYKTGERKTAFIAVEVKEMIMYSFSASEGRLLGELTIWVELKGEESGSDFRARAPIEIPFTVLPGSTAIKGVHYTVKDDATGFVVERNERKATITLQFLDLGGEDKILNLGINPPAINSEYYYPGNFSKFKCLLTQLQIKDIYGKWKPEGIINKDLFELAGIDPSDYTNLPENNATNDYIEFANVNGTDQVIPHLTGSVKGFFNGISHPITFAYIEEYLDFVTEREFDIPYFEVGNVNRNFSMTHTTIGAADIGLEKIDENTLIIYFHDLEPTDFFSVTYEDWGGFDKSFMGISYKFTRVVESKEGE